MKCKVRKIKNFPIFHFDFEEQYDLTSTFVRMQEHYESPFYKHNVQHFSLDEYMDWYVKIFGVWDYFDKWDGFNIPNESVKSFFRIFSGKLRPKEKWILEQLKKFKSWPGLYGNEKYYIICTWGADKTCLHHEIRHALFDLDKKYAREVSKEIKKYSLTNFKRYLINLGYSNRHLIDEINAYACSGWADFIPTSGMIRLSKELKKIEKKYFNGRILA